MSVERSIDWRKYLNRLMFCYGCGRLGLPRKGKTLPTGWKLLYQPHPEGVPGLHVCSDDCNDAVRLAMMAGPVTSPLMMPEPGSIMLPAEVRRAMEDEVLKDLEAQNARLAKPVDSDTTEGETNGGDSSETPAGTSDSRQAQHHEEEPE